MRLKLYFIRRICLGITVNYVNIIEDVFIEFAAMSGLDLNIPATLLTPLGPRGVRQLRRTINKSLTKLANVKITDVGRYLGFQLGLRRRAIGA